MVTGEFFPIFLFMFNLFAIWFVIWFATSVVKYQKEQIQILKEIAGRLEKSDFKERK
ncbi:hypothetical protein [Jeotgalibacillus sp. JSM ZJ347]|uniref:hypothetical protein n=1 Tax=Jeotgalibacillus sp. JSM ZJ347 TaxID=3342117 RepID=UPI0035A8D6AF